VNPKSDYSRFFAFMICHGFSSQGVFGPLLGRSVSFFFMF